MTLADAAEWLGLESRNRAQWLRRLLLSRERLMGRALLIRVGRNPARPRYRVTKSTLRRYCPELVDPVDDIGRALQALVIGQKREREELRERLDDIEDLLAAMLERARLLRAS